MARPLFTGRGDQLGHRIELVVAREYDRLAPFDPGPSAAFHLLLALLGEDVGAQDVEEALAFEHFLPEVAGGVAGRMLGVAHAAADGAGVAAAVEWQEPRPLSIELGHHVDLVRVNGEVHQRALAPAEQRRVGVAILLVLADGVFPGLVGHAILHLAGGDGEAVEREQHVHGVVPAGVAPDLARDREPVAVELGHQLGIQTVGRLEVRQLEGPAGEAEPVPEHLERSLEVELIHQFLGDAPIDCSSV